VESYNTYILRACMRKRRSSS